MQRWVKDAVWKLLNDNQASLIAGLTLQGKPRKLSMIAKERVAPPKAVYYIAIDIPHYETVEESGVQLVPANGAVVRASYNVELELLDYGLAQPGESGLFEHTGADFDTFTDRIQVLFRQAGMSNEGRRKGYFSDSTGAYWFRLGKSRDPRQNRRVDVDNRDVTAARAGGRPMFYATVRFRLDQDCVDLAAV